MLDLRASCIVVVENESPVGIVTERDMVSILADIYSEGITSDLVVEDIMSAQPTCLNVHAVLYEALLITQTRDIRHLPVVDQADRLVGVVTQTNISRAHFDAIEKQRENIEAQIRERTRELEKANAELKALTLTDALLQIGNRRAMEVDVQFTNQNAVRYNRPYSIALLDVDYFKNYNDFYGHQSGDEALRSICGAIQQVIRKSDRLYRYGGEEFLLLMPESPINAALPVVDRVLGKLNELALPHEQSPYGYLTLSAGVACFSGDKNGDKVSSWSDLIKIADEFMYRSKAEGRNRSTHD